MTSVSEGSPRRIQVLYLIDGLGGAGAERSLVSLARAYSDLGISLDVAHFRDRQALRPELEARNANVFSLVGPGGLPGRVARARKLIRARRPDLVHTTLVEADIAGRLAAATARVPVPVVSSLVSVLYGPEHLGNPSLRPWKIRAVQAMDASTAQLAARFHALTEHVADVMANRLLLDRDRIDVVPRGRDEHDMGRRTPLRRSDARRQLQVSDSDTLVLAAARQEWQKGLDVLVEAMPVVLAVLPSARLIVAGREGSETAGLRALVSRHRLEDTVRFIGFRRDVTDLLAAADVFVVPSRWEGLGSVLIEAMAMEAPIVASDLAAIREVLKPDEALFVPPEQPAMLADAIVSAARATRPTSDRVARARAHYLERFTTDIVAQEMRAFYERVIGPIAPDHVGTRKDRRPMDERHGPPSEPERRITRRRLLYGAAVGGGSLAAGDVVAKLTGGQSTATHARSLSTSSPVVPTPTLSPSTAGLREPLEGLARWSDPATWGGTLPGPGDEANVTRSILVDRDVRVGSLVVQPGAVLVFDPGQSRTLESTGNVVVRGRLQMRPLSPNVVHRLAFLGIDESRYVGSGNSVLATDVGLWVVDNGALDLAGTRKLAWARAAGTVAQGSTTIELQADPLGWVAGDRIVITPTLSVVEEGYEAAYDSATLLRVQGRTITLSAPTSFAHPAVTVNAGQTFTAEVLNLTRNVVVEGTPGGRAHVMVLARRPQAVAYTSLRYLGPRQPAGSTTKFVLGRYALHLHLLDDTARGSVVEGVVGTDCGSHVFVAHRSHGITFRECISHDTFEEPFWWDNRADTASEAPPTNDLLYDRCVASLVRSDPEFRGFRLSGFFMGAGTGNQARTCVATGVRGNGDASGFIWPEGSEGVWVFEDCVSHNNAEHGLFVWQNTRRRHVITRFTAYFNGSAGISHGAYLNPYEYTDSVLYGNRTTGVRLHANSNGEGLRFVGLTINGAGFSRFAVITDKHNLPPANSTLFLRCAFKDFTQAAVGLLYEGGNGPGAPDAIDFVDCTFGGNEFSLASRINPDSLVRMQDPANDAFAIQRSDRPGILQPAWNARTSPIAPFASR